MNSNYLENKYNLAVSINKSVTDYDCIELAGMLMQKPEEVREFWLHTLIVNNSIPSIVGNQTKIILKSVGRFN